MTIDDVEGSAYITIIYMSHKSLVQSHRTAVSKRCRNPAYLRDTGNCACDELANKAEIAKFAERNLPAANW